MRLKITMLGFIFILCNISFAQIQIISTDASSPTYIDASTEPSITTYLLNPQSNQELVSLEGMDRDYYNQNYYSKTTIPENYDAEIILRYPEYATAGIAAYIDNGNYLEPIDFSISRNAQTILNVNQLELQGHSEIIIRIWFDQDLSNETIRIGAKLISPLFENRIISVDASTYTNEQLVTDVLITGCLEASNISTTGHSEGIAYFSGAIGSSGFESGIVLSSGNAEDTEGPSSSTSTGTGYNGSGDPDLQQLVSAGLNVQDAIILEFDFIPASDSIVFEYIFGSEEFHEYANTNYNDVFGFFLSGPGINGPFTNNAINIALLPNGQPVTIDNIFNNPSYYTGSTNSNFNALAYDGDIEFDGASIPLFARAQVTACETYHIKMAVGDASDGSYDSGVFLKGGSFASGNAFSVSTFNPWDLGNVVYEGCETQLIFCREDDADVSNPVEVNINFEGTAQVGTDILNIPETFIIPAGLQCDTLTITANVDGINEGMEDLTINLETGCPCDPELTPVHVSIYDELDWSPTVSATETQICIGDTSTVSLTLPPGVDLNLIDWQWLNINQTGYSFEVSPTTTTTYELQWSQPCTTFTASVTVEVLEPPIVDLGDDDTIEGYVYNLNANAAPGNSGNWELISGVGTANFTNATSSNTNVTVSDPGIYTFAWTEISLAPNCVDSDTLQIEFIHIPSADFEVTPPACFGNPTIVTFTGDVLDHGTFNWNFGGGQVLSGTGEGPYEIAYNYAGNYTINLLVTEDELTDEHSEGVTMPTELTHNFSFTDDPCFGSCRGTATINPSGGTLPYTYSWDSGTNLAENLCAGDYTIVVTDANGCTVSENFTISQPNQIQANISGEDVDCFGALTGSATVNASEGQAPYSYMWSNGMIGSSIVSVAAGDYQVTITDANNCSSSENITITQPDELQFTLTNDTAICQGNPITIEATVTGGTTNYQYYWDSGFGFTSGPQNVTLTPSQTTLFAVYIQDNNNCRTPTKTMNLTVSPTISLDLTTTNNSCFESCDGKAEINIVGGIAPFSFTWPAPNRIWTNICAGTYQVTMTDNIGCTADTEFTISQPTEIIVDTFSTDALCNQSADGTAWVEVSGGIQPYSYLWENGETTSNITATYGNYSVTVSDNNDCRIEKEISINSPQALSFESFTPETICIGGNDTLRAILNGGTLPYNYTWTSNASTLGDADTLFVNPTTTTTYTVSITDANGCTTTKDYIVNVYPELSITRLSTNLDTVCVNDAIRLFVDAEGGNGGPYSIQLEDGQTINPPFTFYPQETDTYYITLSDNCSTPQVTDSIKINVWPTPDIGFTSDKVDGCPELQVQFNETSEDESGKNNYSWNFGDDEFAHTKNPTHIYENSGSFTVTLAVETQNGCRNQLTKHHMIHVFPKPEVDFYASPIETNILNPSIDFSVSNENITNLVWDFGDGDTAINQIFPTHTYTNTGEFEVILIGENGFGCYDTVAKKIIVREYETFYVPNTFTPNNDGINDCFRICGKGIDLNDFHLSIYDRWGQIVFETDVFDPNASCSSCTEGAWDGTLTTRRANSSDVLPNGIYVWYVEFKDAFGNLTQKHGEIRIKY